jgi:ELWxxDGT repeat protein
MTPCTVARHHKNVARHYNPPMRKFLVLLLLSLALLPRAFAAVPYQVADLRASTQGIASSPLYLASIGPVALFATTPEEIGATRLWRTDGTQAGTFPLLPQGIRIASLDFIVSGNTAYFGAGNSSGWKIWKTDGTVAGTIALTPDYPTSAGVVSVLGDKILFMKRAPERELWVIDANGPRMLRMLPSGSGKRWGSLLTFHGTFYLSNETGLWKSDGTEAGTALLSPVPAYAVTASNDRLFFAGSSDALGGEPWISDGTEAGTHLVTDLTPGTGTTLSVDASAFIPFGTGVLFLGSNGELGFSDGTAGGTRVLLRSPGPTLAPHFEILNGIAYFPFDDGHSGLELWRTDGTVEGTRIVRDASAQSTSLESITAGATRLYYYYDSDGEHGPELYESDGTAAGTHPVPSGSSVQSLATEGYRNLVTNGDTVFFSATDAKYGTEPWISDGSAAGTHLIANLAAEKTGSSLPRSFVTGTGRIYFTADTETTTSIWTSDGTASGTTVLTGPLFVPVASIGSTIFLQKGTQLWKKEGVSGQEVLVKSFTQGFMLPERGEVAAVGGHLFLRAYEYPGYALWATDGTPAGTLQLTNATTKPTGLVELAGQAFFAARADGLLYASDGTPNGTRAIARAHEAVTMTNALFPFGGGLLLFTTPPASTGLSTGLWRFSGTAGEATIVKRFPNTPAISRVAAASIGTALLFTAQLSNAGMQLWATDGTLPGTVLLKEFPASPAAASAPPEIVSIGGRAVFIADDGMHGIEPWVSDGTPGGTRMLRDISAAGSSLPMEPVAIDGLAYFSAGDPEHGRELWQTDGTPGGTQLVADLNPGPADSAPASLTYAGNLLYFAATTAANGTELWAYAPPDTAIEVFDTRAPESAGAATFRVRLTRASTRRVTVDYTTVDGTAAAGRDYTASHATLTFEPGETTKTIAVQIANDTAAGATRAFSLRLTGANAPIQRTTAAGIIEDDDRRADVSVWLAPGTTPVLNVLNTGPSLASNIRLCYTVFPSTSSATCTDPFELAAGEIRQQQFPITSTNLALSATVTQYEPDADPTNNAFSWIGVLGAFATVLANPAVARAGTSGTLTIYHFDAINAVELKLVSSDPAVVRVPVSAVIAPNAYSTTVRYEALASGQATIYVIVDGSTLAVSLRVVGPADVLKTASAIALSGNKSWDYGAGNSLTATVAGITPDTAEPTGSVTFFRDGQPLATVAVQDHYATLQTSSTVQGKHLYTATYTGDSHFFPAEMTQPFEVIVNKARATLIGYQMPGSNNLLIIATGILGHPPAGDIDLSAQGQNPPARATFQKLDEFRSSALLVRPHLDVPTLYVSYTGDGFYDSSFGSLPLVKTNPRERAVRH